MPVGLHHRPHSCQVMPPSHCCEFCLRTNTNWHSLRIAQHRHGYSVLLVPCHFRISSQANTNVLKCSKHSYWPWESKPIRIASCCITERRINSCQFLLVRNSSLYIRIMGMNRGCIDILQDGRSQWWRKYFSLFWGTFLFKLFCWYGYMMLENQYHFSVMMSKRHHLKPRKTGRINSEREMHWHACCLWNEMHWPVDTQSKMHWHRRWWQA